MSPRSSLKRRGFTIAEVLTATVVLSLLVGTVSQIYMGSLRAWSRGTTEELAQQKASWVIERMVTDLREAMDVTPGTAPFDSSFIALRLPAQVWDASQGTYLNQIAVDATGQPYLVPGNFVVYYRGDESGYLDLQGTQLWRRLVTPYGTVLKQYVVADNIADNPIDPDTGNPVGIFCYWPDPYRLRSVEVTVTVQERLGSRTATTTMVGELNMRNK